MPSDLGCELLGVDASASAVATAQDHAGDLTCEYEVGQIPPVPHGQFDVVLLLETMLAFRDKDALLREVHAALVPGGRFAFTVEEGQPLTEHERAAMPAADTVWPIPLPQLHEALERTGFTITSQQDHTDAHREVVDSLLAEFTTHEAAIAAQIEPDEHESLLTSHRLWSEWLRTGRIRKFAIVATAQPARRGSGAAAVTPQDRAQRSDSA